MFGISQKLSSHLPTLSDLSQVSPGVWEMQWIPLHLEVRHDASALHGDGD